MKPYLRKLQIALSICVMLSFLLVRPAVAATPSVIDHFSVAQNLSLVYLGDGVPVTGSNFVTGAEILGGERDLIATVSSKVNPPSAKETFQADVSNHSLAISSGNGLIFTTEIQWDGTADVIKSAIDPIGLRNGGLTGVDLTAGGRNRFAIGVTSSDVGGTFIMRVYSSATACSQNTFSLPMGITTFNQTIVERAYSLFTVVSSPTNIICPGYTSLATMNDVGAISLSIMTLNSSPSLDMSMDLLEEDSNITKDYGDLPVNADGYNYDMFRDSVPADAYHHITGLNLGAGVTAESGNPAGLTNDLTATSDGLDDGVVPSGLPWSSTGPQGGQVSVTVSGCVATCYLTAFVDWNQDKSFWDVPLDAVRAGEMILYNAPVVNGPQNVKFDIPVIAGVTDSNFANQIFYSRFRITDSPMTQGTPYGAAYSGEVEDYRWTFGVTAVKVERLNASSPAAPLQPILPFAAAVVIAAGAGVVGLVRRRKQA